MAQNSAPHSGGNMKQQPYQPGGGYNVVCSVWTSRMKLNRAWLEDKKQGPALVEQQELLNNGDASILTKWESYWWFQWICNFSIARGACLEHLPD